MVEKGNSNAIPLQVILKKGIWMSTKLLLGRKRRRGRP
jgi:hypothetical protein